MEAAATLLLWYPALCEWGLDWMRGLMRWCREADVHMPNHQRFGVGEVRGTTQLTSNRPTTPPQNRAHTTMARPTRPLLRVLVLAITAAAAALLSMVVLLAAVQASSSSSSTTTSGSRRRGALLPVPAAFQPPRAAAVARQARPTETKLWWGLFGGGNAEKGGKGQDPGRSTKTKNCKVCEGSGAVPCPTCGGTGVDKKNGAIFERYKCLQCQGFGLVNCKSCNPRGLTPEQRGER
jgi:hypothetical protein